MSGVADDIVPDDLERQRFLDGLRSRHAPGRLDEALRALRALKVLVVGETIIDAYDYCITVGKAPKDPMLSTRHVRAERHAGGAVACANHVAAFCEKVDLVSGLGGLDPQEPFIRSRLAANVGPRFVVREGAPSITKRRYLSEQPLTKLFEVVEMDDSPLPAALEDELLAHLEATLPAYDLVIALDYGHGLIGPRTIELLASRARCLAVNTQANPANLGFHVVTRYPRADYACIDEREARLAVRDRWSPLHQLSEALRAQIPCAVMAVTRASRGVLVSGADGTGWDVPVLTREVVDRMGAGDAFLAVSAPCVAAGLPLDVVGVMGSAAAALAVKIVGNSRAADPAALRQLLDGILP